MVLRTPSGLCQKKRRVEAKLKHKKKALRGLGGEMEILGLVVMTKVSGQVHI